MVTSIIMIIGAVFIGIFSLPNLIKVLRTKNTSYIHLTMYIIFTFACVMFSIYGGGVTAHDLGTGLPILLSNIFCVIIATITLTIKFINMRRAKKAGLTELQYWEKHYKKTQEKP